MWVNLSAEIKEQIKTNVLGTLASPRKDARKGAAQAVSAIATIELPRGEWDKIIEVLTTNANGKVLEYKLASLETLGYICEELPNNGLSPIHVNLILSALIFNLMSNTEVEDVKLYALTALVNCIKFCEENFKLETEKDTIINNVLFCCNSPNEEIRMKAMLCLLEIVRYFYDYIEGKTLENIGIATFNDIRNDTSDQVPLMALEIWCSICDEEIDRLKSGDASKPCKDYIRTAYAGLLALLLESLKKKSENDEEDWNLSVASACCLSLVALIIKDPIADSVLAFVRENIGSPDWKSRDAALLSFISILKGPQKATMGNVICQAIDTLLNLLKDPSSHVRETTGWAFSKISEDNVDILLDPTVLPKVMSQLLLSIKDAPRVSNQICFSIYNLAEKAKQKDEMSNAKDDSTMGPLSIYFKSILDSLWANGFRQDAFDDGVNLANSSFVSFSNIIQYSSQKMEETLFQVLQLLGGEFQQTLQPSYRAPTKVNEYQGYLCSAMQPTFIKLTGKISQQLTNDFVDIILESFKQRKSVYEEGILAMSGLITSTGRDFQLHMEKFGPYLIYALKNTEDTALCRVAVGCVGDIARGLEDLVAGYLDQIMPVLMEILRNENTDRDLKLIIITTLSDLAMVSTKCFLLYLKDVLDMLKSAAQLSLQPQMEDDPELPIYIKNLKEAIIEGYTGIVYGINVAKDTTIMNPYIEDIFKYIECLCVTDPNMEQDFLKSIVGLIGDIGDLYGNLIKEILNLPFITRIVGILSKATNKDCKNVADWAKNAIERANN